MRINLIYMYKKHDTAVKKKNDRILICSDVVADQVSGTSTTEVTDAVLKFIKPMS